ncbi:ABC transporter substrate-binding protein [Paenibacillus vini]|uniref:ABC transporter substrate-binding protein n=1 Tax=Paenibacillus vini TaxID=1476024 RepID=A0ABQ4MIP4_9BACL|nr:extracellular solute-binding protein [Paenibacillus vini]GIP55856.1 hypothetical protein J42TS3_48910 [Paenibacillus vini]
MKLILMTLSLGLAAGCAGNEPRGELKSKTSLKVLFSDEDYFFRQYGDLFVMKNGNVDIEVVSTQDLRNNLGDKTYDDALDELVERERPDILMVSTDIFERYAGAGKLAELDPLLEKDHYSLEAMLPGLVDTMRKIGGGKLYGLPPSFYGSAVYYNKDLFTKYGIEPPQDGMTWEEIMELARHFPAEGDELNRVYGYGANYSLTFENLLSLFSHAEGLTYVNPETMKMTIDTVSWRKVYETALSAYHSNAIYGPSDEAGASLITTEESMLREPFIMGRAALTVNGSHILQKLKQAEEMIKDYEAFEVGLVSGPVDPADRETTREISFGDITAINANSTNPEAAWEFFRFLHGGELAAIKSKTPYSLMSRSDYKMEYNGVALDAFYTLKPTINSNNADLKGIPSSFFSEFQIIRNRETQLFLSGEKSLEEALNTMQAEGQAALDLSLENTLQNM